MGMNALIEDRKKIEAVFEELMAPPSELGREIARLEAIAASKSRFKLGQRVRVCQSPGLSLVGGIHALPHDHDDPDQHWNSRVVGWDHLGRIEIATQYGDNPHCCEWPYGEDTLTLIEDDDDWVEKSSLKPDMKVCFKWELPGFFNCPRVGATTPALIRTAHIEVGDWIVRYRKPSGYWITRVLNEKLMSLVSDQ